MTRFNLLVLLLFLFIHCTSSLKWAPSKVKLSNAIAYIGYLHIIMTPFAALAFGPVEIPLNILSYKPVALCNGQPPTMPGQKAAEGLYPICIEVEAKVQNPGKATLNDVSVYGFVKEDGAGNSVLPNNPDFKSDSGQYAMVIFTKLIHKY